MSVPLGSKTGTAVYVSYQMCVMNLGDRLIDMNKIFFITGMSDCSWVNQTKERVMKPWKENVYHRNQLKLFKKRIELLRDKKQDKNILLIIDECHIANQNNHTMSKYLRQIGLSNITSNYKKNIRILQISATPSNVLVDIETCRSFHSKIVVPPKLLEGYVSFKTFISEGRLRNNLNMFSLQDIEILSETIHSYNNPKYHFIRLSCKGSNQDHIITSAII